VLGLHFQRKKYAERAAREAAGESFWTKKFDDSARTRILHSFKDAVGAPGNIGSNEYYIIAHGLILRSAGLLYLVRQDFDPATDLLNYLLKCPDDMIPSVVEVMSIACNDDRIRSRTHNWDSHIFDQMVNGILREHRISYELAGCKMIEFSSREIHEEVVVPTLQLLAGRPDLARVESAYQAALGEISKGEPANAITDAGTALQEMLTALGCSGNALGPLIKSAREKGLLARHDSPLVNAIDKILNWVSADRSELGDAHEVSSAAVDDAWFTVHIVGAILLRLSKSALRSL
jgi:hypothetical protein